jgi:hypothetical protein
MFNFGKCYVIMWCVLAILDTYSEQSSSSMFFDLSAGMACFDMVRCLRFHSGWTLVMHSAFIFHCVLWICEVSL